jgi:cystathionine gamma-lyase/homocysteine desulfhydrase
MAKAKKNDKLGLSTLAIHAGQVPDPTTGAIVMPIYQTSTYVQEGIGQHKGYEYTRSGNPTRRALEDNIAALEGGHGGIAFATGMAAISTLVSYFDAGTHFVCSANVYGGTFRLFERVHRRQGYDFSWVDTRDAKAVERAIKKNTKMLFLETPTNPLMHVCDLKGLSKIAHAHGVKVAVDNTFLTPYWQRPIEHGADFVVHSATKYLGGHSDVLGGLLVTNDADDTTNLRFIAKSIGGVLSPFDAWLILRGIKTLAVRMRTHEENATAIAKFLEGHKKVARVHYPGLKTHEGYALNRKQAGGAGGLLSFELVKGASPEKFLKATKICALAESLGAVETLLCVPAKMTHASVPAEERKKLGIGDGLLRIAVGVEDIEDLIADVDQALARA